MLVLRGADEEMQFQILGPDRLRLLAHDGTPIGSQDHALTAGETFVPFDPHLPLRGMLTYVADEARFTECLTGRDYPLVKDGDYAALEHAYLAAGAEAGRADHGELRRRHRPAAGGRRRRTRGRRCWSTASSGSGRARPASGRWARRA